VVGARRNALQTVISLAVAAILLSVLIGTLFVLVKYFAAPGPDREPKPDRPFEEHL